MKTIQADHAPAAVGPYSHAVTEGNLVFTSGQIPLSPQTGDVVGEDIQSQTRQVMANLEAVLSAAGAGFDTVLKSTCYLSDMSDFPAFNEIYAEFFITRPARSCVAVKTLPKNVLVEVEVIATLKR